MSGQCAGIRIGTSASCPASTDQAEGRTYDELLADSALTDGEKSRLRAEATLGNAAAVMVRRGDKISGKRPTNHAQRIQSEPRRYAEDGLLFTNEGGVAHFRRRQRRAGVLTGEQPQSPGVACTVRNSLACGLLR